MEIEKTQSRKKTSKKKKKKSLRLSKPSEKKTEGKGDRKMGGVRCFLKRVEQK